MQAVDYDKSLFPSLVRRTTEKIGEKNKSAPRKNWEREAPRRFFSRRFLFVRATDQAGKDGLLVVYVRLCASSITDMTMN